MDLTPEQLQSTLAFLHTLAVYPRNLRGDFSDNALFTSLINHLKADGYGLQSFDAVDSRRLSGEVSGSSFYMDLALIFMCVLCAGLASGLTQGLLSLDFLEMKIKSQSGTPKEKEYATKVIPIIKHHHLLLVTLMLWNASATEALPIFLNSLVPEVVAIIISVTLVLMFGEIIPASILTGPKQLEIAASLTPLVYFVYVIFFPIAYPISKLLDYIIGHEEGMTLYSRREIATMMKMQHEEAVRRLKSGDAVRDSVHNDEMTIIGGALKFRDMKASDVMTTLENVFMLSAKENLSYKTLYEIFKAGYSRIPVYDKDKNDIIGLLLAKDLIFVDPEDETPINNFVEFFGRRPVMVWHDQLLGEILSTFRRERAHLAIVRDVVFEGEGDPYYKVVGIITLEDIIEEILGAEIEDEFDAAEGEGDEHWHLRDMDLARLKSLRSKITDDSLSEDEINAIVSFLPKNVPQVVEYATRYKLQLSDVITKSHVFLLKKQTPEGASKPHPNDVIVRKGKFTNTCILILQGRVKVVQELEPHEKKDGEKEGENDVVRTEQIVGPWSTLCADALLSSDGTFAPSFSAYIYSNDLRFLRISTIFSAAYSLSHTRFVDKKRHHGDVGVQRVRIASSPDSNYINLRGDLNRLSRNKTHNGEVKTSGHGDHGGIGGDVRESISGGGTDSLLLRRSITADPAFRPSRALSGTDESLAWSGNDRKSVLLANMSGPGNAGGNNSFPAPGSSYRSEYEPIDVSRVSVSQKKGGLKKERPSVSSNVVVSDAESSTSDNSSSSSTTSQKRTTSPEKTAKKVVTGNSLLTPLIRQDEKEEGDSTVVNKLHENK